MLLAIDVGNTNIVFAIIDNDKTIGKWRITTDTKRTSNEYAIIFKDLFNLHNIDFSAISDVIISSVVPQNLFELKSFCKEYISQKPLIVGEPDVNIGIGIKVDQPKEVGADRLVNAVAAFDLYKGATIIIDFGTATTFDVINGKGDYIGGLIAPGINLSLDALHLAAAKLPEIVIKKPKEVIGKSTVSAMQSGIYFGYTSLIEGIIDRIKDQSNEEFTVVATGGLSPLFSSATEKIEHLEPELTIQGLHKIHKINN